MSEYLSTPENERNSEFRTWYPWNSAEFRKLFHFEFRGFPRNLMSIPTVVQSTELKNSGGILTVTCRRHDVTPKTPVLRRVRPLAGDKEATLAVEHEVFSYSFGDFFHEDDMSPCLLNILRRITTLVG